MSKSTTEHTSVETSFARTDTDAQYRVLASEDRQLVLEVLEGTSSMTLESLTEAVTEKKTTDTTETRTKISLVHQHLPVMEDAGVVDYDSESKRITHSQQALEDLLDLL